MRWRILVIAVLICSAIASRAGGPALVAGSGYAPGVEGQPLVWANGSVQYFTDQGNLSPILPGAQADAFVATAFSTWTSISSVALTASQGGHLAEDVNGSNIAVDSSATITAPPDIRLQPRAPRLELFTITTERSPIRCWARGLEAWLTVLRTPPMEVQTSSPRAGTLCMRWW